MYEVGQILYTIIENRQKVYPVKVVEQVVKKTLEGEFVEYTVKIPGAKDKNVSLKKFKKIFNNLEEVNSYLTNNAKSAINRMIESAQTLQNSYFKEEVILKEDIDINEACNDVNSDVIIDLGDGQKGKLSISNLEDIGQKKT
jgi:hypothetical protein